MFVLFGAPTVVVGLVLWRVVRVRDVADPANAAVPERVRLVRATAKLAGVVPSDIVRIRNVDLDRFTIDRLLRTVHRLDDRVRVQVTQAGEGEAA